MKLNDHQCPALVRGARLQPDPKTGEPMLLFPEGVIHLSETANDVLLLCDGKTTLGTLISSLAEQYEIEPNVVSKDVRECLIELMGHNLITI